MEQRNSDNQGLSLSGLVALAREKGIKALFLEPRVRELVWQFIKFGLVGVSNTLISLGVYYLCVNLLDMHYQLANLLGFVISVTNAYYWNSRYVFKMGTHRTFGEHLRTYAKTVTAYGGTYLLSTGLLWLWVDVVGISENIAPLINLCITIPLNFIINKLWTFRKKPAEEGAAESGAPQDGQNNPGADMEVDPQTDSAKAKTGQAGE